MNRVTFENSLLYGYCFLLEFFKSIVLVHFIDLGQAVFSCSEYSILAQCSDYMYCFMKFYGLG